MMFFADLSTIRSSKLCRFPVGSVASVLCFAYELLIRYIAFRTEAI